MFLGGIGEHEGGSFVSVVSRRPCKKTCCSVFSNALVDIYEKCGALINICCSLW